MEREGVTQMVASPVRGELSWARSLLLSADLAHTPGARQQTCLLAARHGADVLLSGRGRGGDRRAGRPITEPAELWTRLAAELPAFAEWASYFALLEGRRGLSERQSDDLLRDLSLFLDLVGQQLSRPRPERIGHG